MDMPAVPRRLPLAAAAAPGAFAADPLVDDFTTGQYASPQAKTTLTNVQAGAVPTLRAGSRAPRRPAIPRRP